MRDRGKQPDRTLANDEATMAVYLILAQNGIKGPLAIQIANEMKEKHISFKEDN